MLCGGIIANWAILLRRVYLQLVKQSIAKDKYLMQLEKRMKENDMKRQATYLQVLGNCIFCLLISLMTVANKLFCRPLNSLYLVSQLQIGNSAQQTTSTGHAFERRRLPPRVD